MFNNLGLNTELIGVLGELGFQAPTPIQSKSIPLILQGKDLIAQAQTGSGKTAAFALPILQRVELRPIKTQVLVLCPTRELCTQVARDFRKFGRKCAGLQVLIVSGGAPIGPQLSTLEKGVHIVVGTPGRVLDHLLRNTLDLSQVKTLVLDEADRMLDMGFQDDMEKILKNTPPLRQTLLFSATFPTTIEGLSRKYQKSPVRVTVEETLLEKGEIKQIAFEASPDQRASATLWVIEQNKIESAIIFCNFKASVFNLEKNLSAQGLSVGAIHGDLEQRDRDRVMAKFRNKSTRILIATDVAARGIDIPELEAVINYELPAQAEVYVHRIGRTGRAGQKGLAISFYTSKEKSKIQSIENLTEVEFIKKSVPNLDRYQFNKNLDQASGEALMKTLYISGGRKQKLRAGDILGALTGEAGGLPSSDIGKIEIHDNFSYVAVSSKIAGTALARLNAGRIKGRKFRVEPVR